LRWRRLWDYKQGFHLGVYTRIHSLMGVTDKVVTLRGDRIRRCVTETPAIIIYIVQVIYKEIGRQLRMKPGCRLGHWIFSPFCIPVALFHSFSLNWSIVFCFLQLFPPKPSSVAQELSVINRDFHSIHHRIWAEAPAGNTIPSRDFKTEAVATSRWPTTRV